MPRLRWMFIAALAVLLFCITSTVYFFEARNLFRLQAKFSEKSQELAKKERFVKEYREKVAFYKTDEGIAHWARENSILAFPGERVYIVIKDSSENVMEVMRP